MGIISSYMNLIGNAINQSFNAEQAAINRRWQEQMYQKQFSDNVQLWKMQQDYNSPVNQVARYKEAGINPYLALQNISTGSAQSAPQSAQAGSGAQATGVNPQFAGITDSILNLLRSNDERNLLKEQATNLSSDSLSKRIDAMTQHQKNLADIISRLSGSDKDVAEAALSRSLKTTEDELRGWKKQEYIDNTKESFLTRISQIQSIKAFPVQLRLQLAEKIANIAVQKQVENWTAEKYRGEVYRTILDEARAGHAHIDYDTARQIQDDIIEQTGYTTKSKPILDALGVIFGTAQAAQNFRSPKRSPRLSGKSTYDYGNGKKDVYYHYLE